MIGFGVPDLTLMDTSKKENKKEANQKFFKTCWDDIQKTKIHDTCILHYIVDINILCTSYAQFSDTLSYVHSLHFSQKQHARCRGAFSWAGVLLKKNRNRVTNGPTTTSRMTSHPQATHLDGCQEATPNRSPQGLADLLYLLLHLLSTKADLQREKINPILALSVWYTGWAPGLSRGFQHLMITGLPMMTVLTTTMIQIMIS